MSNDNKPKTEYRVGVGASSILMVLVVLALTAVGLLSFRNAKNAESLTERNLLMTTAYYEASARVQEKLAAMDAELADLRVNAQSLEEETLIEQLEYLEMEELTFWQEDDGLGFSFVEDANYARQIEVDGILPEAGERRYIITRYQLISHPHEEDEFMEFRLIGG